MLVTSALRPEHIGIHGEGLIDRAGRDIASDRAATLGATALTAARDQMPLPTAPGWIAVTWQRANSLGSGGVPDPHA